MSVISRENNVVTVIVEFTMEPEEQDNFLNALERVSPVLAKQPGLISFHVHKSTDGKKVINYQQWETEEAYKACHKSPQILMAILPIMGMVQSKKVSFEAHVYDIVLSEENK